MFKSIKTKIIFTVITLFLLGVGTMTSISGMQVKNKTEESIIEQSTVLIDEMSHSTSNFLEQFSKGLYQLSNTTSVQDYQGTNSELLLPLENELSGFIDLFKDASSVYYSGMDGKAIIRPYVDLGSDFDSRERDWFNIATNSPDKVQWSTPYVDAASGEVVVTASKAVRDSSTTTGVVGLDVQLTALMNVFAEKELGHGGYPV